MFLGQINSGSGPANADNVTPLTENTAIESYSKKKLPVAVAGIHDI
jgi:hypothetical protein